ncbi:glycine cleavage system aminomethyltransferase GcvT [Desulfitibacter alkalitolerans]|uniref:glycine cleavage system aminomethyltransferase GcvT n=1 Tax=Desulfitibacter alkalitolerans TaxID=264641 RepID=UPI0005577907|nr:glycine cleavage system aminomethyltransferase GcvT [Desulfitibacter alkalitolerans]
MELKLTPLYEAHVKLGAKMVDFGGWHMPVEYQGIIEEHMAVRTKAGLFDVSHMGEIWIRGQDALGFVQKMVTNDVSKLNQGQIQYAILCNEKGGTVDDLLVYKMAQDQFLLVVNAGNKEKDFKWMMQHKAGKVEITDKSDNTAQLAIQGPMSLEILQSITDINLSNIKYYCWEYGEVNGIECLISRTGYTGEDGFEIYFEPEYALDLWEKILMAGAGNIVPVGLGARDTLRFEAGMPLYGHELGEDISPLEARLGKFVALEKEYFIGIEALKKQKAEGVYRKLVGFEMVDRGIARSDYPVFVNEEEVGFVTTGSPAPFLNKNLGNALVKVEYANVGRELLIDIRGKKKKAVTIATPFYKKGGNL